MKLDRACTLDDLPIPQDVRVTRKWTGQMRELAAHIGPYRTLQIVDALGGQEVNIPKSAERNRLAALIGEEGARIMSAVYGGNFLRVPVARAARDEARRAGIIAAIRAKKMTIADAVPILGTSRSYLSSLVNGTAEGADAEPYVPKKSRHDPRQIDMFAPAPSDGE